MSMNIMGSYSGIDKAQIDKLMEAEKLPLVQMSNKKVTIDQQKSAWKDVNSRLRTLFDKMEALKDKKLFESKLATSSDDKILTAKANDKAIAGVYKINVERLATNTRLVGNQVGSDWKASKDSILTIQNEDFKTLENDIEKINKEMEALESNGKEKTSEYEDLKSELGKLEKKKVSGGGKVEISIKKGDSLETVADKINEASKRHITKGEDGEDKKVDGSGVRATVVDGRLILEDSKTGARSIDATGDVLGEVGLNTKSYVDSEGYKINNKGEYIGADNSVVDEENKVEGEGTRLDFGQTSKFEVNGIKMESDSNNVSDKVRGLTLNFNDTGKSTITVADDSAKMEKAVQEFVDQYNSTMTFIDEQLKAGDPEVKDSRGALAGDSALMGLQRNLRSLVTDKMNRRGNGENFEIDSPSQLGISTVDEKGALAFDTLKFKEAMKENPNGVRDFFGKEDTGFVDRFNGHIDKMISTKNGIIKTKNETFDRALKDLTKQIDNFNDRMERKEKYYIKTFTALDVAMMQAESQMSWLSNQVSAMNPGK